MAIKKEVIYVFCAHSDDQIFGPGATLAKYASLGKEIHIVIFFYGEGSHPHFKREEAVKMRVKESQEANKVIGGKSLTFLGLNEMDFSFKKDRFMKDFKAKNIVERMTSILEEKKPTRIFTHSREDSHPGHRFVCETVLKMFDKLSYKPEVLAFDVWGFNTKGTDSAKFYVDVTDFFEKKIQALKCFPSQWMSMVSLLWSVYFKAIKDGFKCKCKYAEKFYKLR